MQVAQQILVLLHLIGFAALLGGVLVQLRDREPEVSTSMLYGALLELLTGVSLYVLSEQGPGSAVTSTLVVKAVLTVVVTVLVVANRRYAFIPRGLLVMIGSLTLIAAGISVFAQ